MKSNFAGWKGNAARAHARMEIAIAAILVTVWLVLGYGTAQAQVAGVEQEIESRLERLTAPGALLIKDAPIIADRLIKNLYAIRENRPAWTSKKNVAALLAQIDESKSHGLDPDDFHRAQIIAFNEEVGNNGAAPATRRGTPPPVRGRPCRSAAHAAGDCRSRRAARRVCSKEMGKVC